MKMNIKNASQRVVSNEAYTNTTVDTTKVSEAGKNLVKDTFENAKSSETQKGKKEISFDEARLAATVDYNNVGKPASQYIDGEALSKNHPGVSGNGKDPALADLKQKVAEQKQKVREGLNEPTGPNIGPVIDQLVSGEIKVETEGTKKAEEDRKGLKDGATGKALLESANDNVKTTSTYGKDMLSAGGDLLIDSLPATVTKNPDGTTTKTREKAWSDDGIILIEQSKTTFDKDGNLQSNTDTLTEYNGGKKVVTVTESLKDKTVQTVTTTDTTTGNTTTKTTTTSTSPDGTKTTTITEKTTKGGGVKMPDEDHQFVLPEGHGFQQVKVDGVVHRNGSGDGGDIDPDSNATPTGPVFNDAQIHLQEMGKYGMVGQPDQTFRNGGGTGTAGTGQLGGDIDMGPDSPSQGYIGATRTEDPADVNFNVGAEPLIGSKEEKKKAKEEEEEGKAVLKNFMYRRIQA